MTTVQLLAQPGQDRGHGRRPTRPRGGETGTVPAPLDAALTDVRGRLGASIMRMIAGAEPSPPRGLSADDTDRRFPAGSPISTVHGDASMFVGGLSALLLQALHPLAMAGVADHSDYRRRPVGPPRSDQPLPRPHDVRDGRGGRRRRGRGTGRAPPGPRRRARTAARTRRRTRTSSNGCTSPSSTSFLRAHRRYGATRLGPAGRGPLRRPGRRDRPRARGAVGAGDGRRAAGRRWTGSAPSWRARRPPATSPATSCWSRRWPDRPVPPTRRSPPPPSPCCPAGPAGPCGCRGCLSPRRPSCAPAGRRSPARSAGRSAAGSERGLAAAGTGSSSPRAHRAGGSCSGGWVSRSRSRPPTSTRPPRRRSAHGTSSPAWPRPRRRASTARSSWPPTRPSRSTARSSASRSTPPTPAGCSGGCRAAPITCTRAWPCGPASGSELEVVTTGVTFVPLVPGGRRLVRRHRRALRQGRRVRRPRRRRRVRRVDPGQRQQRRRPPAVDHRRPAPPRHRLVPLHLTSPLAARVPRGS